MASRPPRPRVHRRRGRGRVALGRGTDGDQRRDAHACGHPGGAGQRCRRAPSGRSVGGHQPDRCQPRHQHLHPDQRTRPAAPLEQLGLRLDRRRPDVDRHAGGQSRRARAGRRRHRLRPRRHGVPHLHRLRRHPGGTARARLLGHPRAPLQRRRDVAAGRAGRGPPEHGHPDGRQAVDGSGPGQQFAAPRQPLRGVDALRRLRQRRPAAPHAHLVCPLEGRRPFVPAARAHLG